MQAASGRSGAGENVVGAFKGAGGKNLLLMAHMDTVCVRGTLARSPWHVEGNRACGHGIGYHANVCEWISIDAIPRRLVLSAQIIMDVAQGR